VTHTGRTERQTDGQTHGWLERLCIINVLINMLNGDNTNLSKVTCYTCFYNCFY